MPKRFKVIITDAEYASHEPEREVLSKFNVELVKYQCRTEDEVIENCRDADALLNQYAPITRRVIESLEKAKVIVRYGIGVDNIDLEAATERGIYVANVIYDICDVADHAVTLMLSLNRKITLADKSVKEGCWDWKPLQPIMRVRGRTVGIVGFGRVGREVAKRVRCLGVRIMAYDPYLPPEVFEENRVERVDLDTLLRVSDIITLHVALTDETYHMIGAEELRKMKRTALLINASRGAVVDEKALYRALKEGWIAGAALDVMEKEPPDRDNPILSLDNVIVTPHMAWYSTASVKEIQRKAAEEVARVLSGKAPINLVNKDVLKVKSRG
ncbi:C-terminal binding protein [Candidatus Bathyarchaeota archaeon]|nr:MAG: C-terminal binding protein [Candidatus Bathyarchaeota archaeon]